MSALKQVSFRIQGVCPLLMHSSFTVTNPTAPLVKELKAIAKQRNKDDDALEEMARLEFHLGIYTDATGRPAIPGQNIEKMLIDAGKNQKLGKEFTAKLFSDGDWPLIYDGPKDADKLWASGKFRDSRRVVVSRQGIVRTRPIFRNWSLEFSIHYMDIDEDKIRRAVEFAGRNIGLGDYRPKYGRFDIVS